MNYSLNSLEKKGNEIVQNLDATLNLILSMVNADHVQLLFEPNEKDNFNQSLCVFRTQKPEPALIKTLSDITCNTTYNSGEFIELSEFSSTNTNRYQQRSNWWSLPLYAKQKRHAILNVALPEPGDCLKLLSQYLTALLLPMISKMPSKKFLSSKNLETNFANFESTLPQIKNKEELYELIKSFQDSIPGFETFTIYLYDEREERLVNFFHEQYKTGTGADFKDFLNLEALSFVNTNHDFGYSNLEDLLDFDRAEGNIDLSPFLINPARTNTAGHLTQLTGALHIKGILIFQPSEQSFDEITKLPAYSNLIKAISEVVYSLKQEYDSSQAEIDAFHANQAIQHLDASDSICEFLSDSTRILKNLFNFEHHALAMVDQEQLSMSVHQDNEYHVYPQIYKTVEEFKHTISLGDRLINQALFSQQPMFFDLELLSLRNALPSYFSQCQKNGISRVLMISINGSEQVLGLWIIWLAAGQYISTGQLLQLRRLTDEIASKFGTSKSIKVPSEIVKSKKTLSTLKNAKA